MRSGWREGRWGRWRRHRQRLGAEHEWAALAEKDGRVSWSRVPGDGGRVWLPAGHRPWQWGCWAWAQPPAPHGEVRGEGLGVWPCPGSYCSTLLLTSELRTGAALLSASRSLLNLPCQGHVGATVSLWFSSKHPTFVPDFSCGYTWGFRQQKGSSARPQMCGVHSGAGAEVGP